MCKNLNIVIWNANGLALRTQELKTFLYNENIDIMLISETHFTNKSYLKIYNYNIYFTNHPDGKAHGGTAIIIKSEIQHFENEHFQKDYLQATNVTVEDSNGNFTLSAVYCPPKYSISQEKFTEFFNSLGFRFIAGGDYNAKHPWWGSRSLTPNPKGRQLYATLKSQNLTPISTGEPTYWPSDKNKLPDLIDFAVTKGINPERFSAKSCLDLTSDHSPIIITLNTITKTNTQKNSLFNKKTNWTKYKAFINEHLSCNIPLKTTEDIENAIEKLNIYIHEAILISTPAHKKCDKTINISQAVRAKITEKRKLRKIWQNTRSKTDKAKLNKSSKELKKLISDETNNSIQKYLQHLTPEEATDYSLWKATRKIKRPKTFIPPIRNSDGQWARTDTEKANVFAQHFKNIFEPPERVITEIEENILLNNLTTNEQTNQQTLNVKVKEILQVIKTLKPKKAPGYDGISGKLIKELPIKAVRFITIIINSALRLNYFPYQWKVAQIILINKPGKQPELVTSYRPISLLPILSKIYEIVILEKLNPIIEKNNLIPQHQFGFRKKHGTIEQVNRVVSKVRKTIENKNICNAVFLDVAQAFDKVWHKGLLKKLKSYFPNNLYKILKSYLNERTFQIKINEKVTELYEIKAGIPQGSVLGPILYLLYTADFPTRDDTTIAQYADDTAILSIHKIPEISTMNLQRHLLEAQAWLNNWRILVNESKSVHVTFTLRKETSNNIYINNAPIPQNEKVKYLGMHLDKRLNWKDHIWNKRKQLNLKTRKLYWLIGKKSKLSTENKILIYKSILKPVWTYGIQLWGAAANSNIQVIERYQNKTIRNILDAPWFVPNELIRKDLHIKSVTEEIIENVNKYKTRLQAHPNKLATNLLKTSHTNSRLKKYKCLF